MIEDKFYRVKHNWRELVTEEDTNLLTSDWMLDLNDWHKCYLSSLNTPCLNGYGISSAWEHLFEERDDSKQSKIVSSLHYNPEVEEI